MNEPLILYSVNSKLAYGINTKFYKKHFVYCSSKYNTDDTAYIRRTNYNSSNPYSLYCKYVNEIFEVRKDPHEGSTFLKNKINSILHGVEENFANHTIDPKTYNEINITIQNLVDSNKIWTEMAPVLYIIPFALVKNRVEIVPPSKAAGILSDEYLIKDLRDDEFDTIVDLGELIK